MKILVVYPAHAWSTKDIADNIFQAFVDLGHQVDPYPLYAIYRLYKRATDLRETDETWRLTMTEALKEKVEAGCYDLALVIHGPHVPNQRVREMNKYVGTTAIWLLDEPYELDLSLTYSHCYDMQLVNDPATLNYHPNAYYLPPAANAKLHYHREDLDEKYCHDVFFSGSMGGDHFAERRRVLLELLPFIYQKRIFIQGITHRMYIPYKELPKFYSGAKIVLNFHRPLTGTAYGDLNKRGVKPKGLNPRVFEVAACGAPLISDNSRSEMSRFFPDAVTFESVPDLVDKIEYYLTREDERRVLIGKTPRYYYKQRAEEIIDIMENKLCKHQPKSKQPLTQLT